MYQVAIVARGNNLSIYINGAYVKSTYDSAATSNSGVIGLGVATGTANTADVVFFTQVQVWQL